MADYCIEPSRQSVKTRLDLADQGQRRPHRLACQPRWWFTSEDAIGNTAKASRLVFYRNSQASYPADDLGKPVLGRGWCHSAQRMRHHHLVARPAHRRRRCGSRECFVGITTTLLIHSNHPSLCVEVMAGAGVDPCLLGVPPLWTGRDHQTRTRPLSGVYLRFGLAARACSGRCGRSSVLVSQQSPELPHVCNGVGRSFFQVARLTTNLQVARCVRPAPGYGGNVIYVHALPS